MGTLIDYIKWRGDLEFWQDGFNIADNLVLSCISYVDLVAVFKDIAEDVLHLDEVCKLYNSKPKAALRENSILADSVLVMNLASSYARYKNIYIRNYVDLNDQTKTLQFAAMEFLLPDGTSYIAYRGTDDTIVGWKEDFLLAVSEVEAERQAVSYLNTVAQNSKRLLRIGGHSKGGHLAVYASIKCNEDIKERIINIYSNDGPGFSGDLPFSPETKKMLPKIIRILPEDSIVGTLMTSIGKPTIVKSTYSGIMQHNLVSWCVEGNSLLLSMSLSREAKNFEKAIKKSIANINDVEKFSFDLFSVFESTGAETLMELQTDKIKNLQAMTRRINELDSDTKEAILIVMKNLLHGMFSQDF